jgi:SAM-dependent methyltransferase
MERGQGMVASTSPPAELPLPPEEMRRLVGPTEPALFDNPSGRLVLPSVPAEAYDSILDFGCGCGRLARQFIQQRPRPRAYLGIDLHRGMVQWCERNLAPHAAGFRFEHHDVWNQAFNPKGSRAPGAFPVPPRSVSLVNAWSVFTHLVEAQAGHYLAEVERVLREDGYFHSTWFLFDKSGFPMMQEFQNTLYINETDPTNAVIFDRRWLLETVARLGLKLVAATPPALRGYQWMLLMTRRSHPRPEVELPEDHAATGIARPPLSPPDAEKIGL